MWMDLVKCFPINFCWDKDNIPKDVAGLKMRKVNIKY